MNLIHRLVTCLTFWSAVSVTAFDSYQMVASNAPASPAAAAAAEAVYEAFYGPGYDFSDYSRHVTRTNLKQRYSGDGSPPSGPYFAHDIGALQNELHNELQYSSSSSSPSWNQQMASHAAPADGAVDLYQPHYGQYAPNRPTRKKIVKRRRKKIRRPLVSGKLISSPPDATFTASHL